MAAPITVTEWQAELERLREIGESVEGGGHTSRELQDVLGLTGRGTERFVRDGIKHGSIRVVWAKRRNRIGVMQPTPTYVLVGGKETSR